MLITIRWLTSAFASVILNDYNLLDWAQRLYRVLIKTWTLSLQVDPSFASAAINYLQDISRVVHSFTDRLFDIGYSI